ncbi:hypothetical protein [Alcaligenes pakistanensis]|uniref:hypothetical protein n=1 Tax=Alcaligenes pakistanensis TaxID=1482717 RepID=UPI0016789746|nr:hypothetical protein [Alcaligenes pakistanensis]
MPTRIWTLFARPLSWLLQSFLPLLLALFKPEDWSQGDRRSSQTRPNKLPLWRSAFLGGQAA